MPRDQFRALLVTGGAGFIGSHLVELLLLNPQYAKVICFDKLDYASNLKNLEACQAHDRFVFVQGDITQKDQVLDVMNKYKVDGVLHLAAQTHVDNSFGNSFSFTHHNVLGTHMLLECSKAMLPDFKVFLHVSTDEVYGENSTQSSFTEEFILEPSNPYAATKAAAEFIVKAYYRSFDLPIVITRGNNCMGPRQYPEKVVSKFIEQMLRGMPLTIHGDGENQRSFLYVADVVAAMQMVLEKGSIGHVYNIGGTESVSISKVAKVLQELVREVDEEEEERGVHSRLVPLNKRSKKLESVFVKDRMYNDQRYIISSAKLWQETGWSPEVPNFREALKKTLLWHYSHRDYWNNIESALEAHPRLKGEECVGEEA